MPNSNPETLAWLDTLAALTAQVEKTPNTTHDQLADALDIPRPTVTFYLAIKACFDEGAIEKVQKAAPAFILSFNSARALSGLIPKRGKEDKVSDLRGSFHAALDLTLFHRLKPKKIEALVKWIISGKPASEFDPKAKPLETPEETTESDTDESESGTDEKKTKRGNAKKVKTTTLGQRIGSGIDKIVLLLGSGQGQTHPSGSTKTPGHGSSKSLSAKEEKAALKWTKKLAKKAAKFPLREVARAEHEICRKLAHAIVSSRRSSHSSSSRRSGRARSRGSFRQGLIALFLTVLHGVVYVLLQYGFLLMVATVFLFPFFPALKPWLEWPFRFAAHLVIFDLPAWVWACAHNYLVPTLVIGVVLAIGLFFAWQAEPLRMTLISAALAYLIVHGRGWSYQLSPFSQTTASETQAVSTPPAAPELVRRLKLGSAKLKTSNSKLSTHRPPPAAAYQPAVSFIPNPSSAETLYNPKILEQEIAAIPAGSVIKDYVFQPDEGMPADLAVSRLQDLTDADKYTMMIGNGKQKILSVTPNSTNFIITYKSTDLFGVLPDGSGTMNIFLEDVQYIHLNEIDHFAKPPTENAAGISSLSGTQPDQIIYQCTVVAKGEKYPLTIQCGSKDDLENLVSTLEYFIRHARKSPNGGLGRDAQPGGLPFPAQGIRFNNDRVVTLLWADSPMDKGGMGLGDHLWSVGNITSEQQSRKELEAALQGAAQGLVLYAASPNEWEKAAIAARGPGSDSSFRPQLKKVSLSQ